jgi:hypothetical protein
VGNMLDQRRVDMTHDHLTLGFSRGCAACAQTEADWCVSARVYEATLPKISDEARYNAHPEPASTEQCPTVAPVTAGSRAGC